MKAMTALASTAEQVLRPGFSRVSAPPADAPIETKPSGPDEGDLEPTVYRFILKHSLRQQILTQLNQENFVDTVRENNVTSTLAVKSAELISGDPYTAIVFGRKRITTLINGQENEKSLLVKYTIRLAPVPRAAANGWAGLEIGDYKEEVLQP